MKSVLDRHEKIAFEFSGGKDSTACLYLLREYLDRITVYHLNTGERPPETKVIVDECRKFIPHFVEIKTDSVAWRKVHGDPSDIVPTFSTLLGRVYGFGDVALSDRFTCCWSNIMWPCHKRVVEDGNTLVIRGTKLVDSPASAAKNGTVDGVELFLPIDGWTDAQVMDYLREVGAPIHPMYDKINDGIECMTCSAWWNSRHLDWLSDAHPETAAIVKQKHAIIKRVVLQQMTHLGA